MSALGREGLDKRAISWIIVFLEDVMSFSILTWCDGFLKHRRRVDILADVLAAAGEGALKTTIMHEANLSYELLRKYLNEAANSDLLKANTYGFELTNKGRDFLQQYSMLFEEYSKVGSALKDLNDEWQALEQQCWNCSGNHDRVNDKTLRKENNDSAFRKNIHE